MRIPLKSILLALIALVAIGSFASQLSETPDVSPTKPASSSGSMCHSNGVTLVVDFGENSKKEALVTCAQNFSGTGWEIFAESGLKVEGTSEFPSSFVCRIQGWPSAEIQDCFDTPTYAEGSWTYYNASGSGGWKLSGAGAATLKPECGTFEGWLFVEPGQDRNKVGPRIEPETFICK